MSPPRNSRCSPLPLRATSALTVEYKNISFMVWDIRGQEFRPLWKHYYQGNGDGLSEGLDWLSSALSGTVFKLTSRPPHCIHPQAKAPPGSRLSPFARPPSLVACYFRFRFQISNFRFRHRLVIEPSYPGAPALIPGPDGGHCSRSEAAALKLPFRLGTRTRTARLLSTRLSTEGEIPVLSRSRSPQLCLPVPGLTVPPCKAK